MYLLSIILSLSYLYLASLNDFTVGIDSIPSLRNSLAITSIKNPYHISIGLYVHYIYFELDG